MLQEMFPHHVNSLSEAGRILSEREKGYWGSVAFSVNRCRPHGNKQISVVLYSGCTLG
jgi:hypothetical protein